MPRKNNRTPSYTSPTNSRRGCLCWDKITYSRKCCEGTLQAQGIGRITKIPNNFLLQENGDYLLKEDNAKIIL